MKMQAVIQTLRLFIMFALCVGSVSAVSVYAGGDDLLIGEQEAQAKFLQNADEKRYLADVQVGSKKDLLRVLERIDHSLEAGNLTFDREAPIVFLLHGKEARSLFKQNYSKNKQLVDLAARLSAFNVADIRVCETWMGGQRLDKNDLQPFIKTIPSAPAEIKRLVKEEGYISF